MFSSWAFSNHRIKRSSGSIEKKVLVLAEEKVKINLLACHEASPFTAHNSCLDGGAGRVEVDSPH